MEGSSGSLMLISLIFCGRFMSLTTDTALAGAPANPACNKEHKTVINRLYTPDTEYRPSLVHLPRPARQNIKTAIIKLNSIGDKVAQLVRCRTSNQRVAGLIPGRGTSGLTLRKTVYSILLQSTQLQNGYLA